MQSQAEVHARKVDAGNIFDNPALGCTVAKLRAMQIHQVEWKGRFSTDIRVQVEVTDIEVTMIETILVQFSGDRGNLFDQCSFELLSWWWL